MSNFLSSAVSAVGNASSAARSASADAEPVEITLENAEQVLAHDAAVKVAGVDVDGVLRGKLMAKSKFLGILKDGFGMCSVVMGWDMHDQTYSKELLISNASNGYKDIIAKPDLSSFRRIPWEHNVPFFLLAFYDPDTGGRVSACPRGLLATQVARLAPHNIRAMAGAEYEFYQFRAPSTGTDSDSRERNSSATARYLEQHRADTLPHLTEGMMGYSLTDPVRNQDWFYEVFRSCDAFNCGIEGWHTESGPGVFEAALNYGEIREMADKASLFKFTTKCVGSRYGITPCFMAKPRQGLPGNSGHMHVSLVDTSTGTNLFTRAERDPSPPYPDLAHLSDLGRHFLAGLLEGLPDVMPILAPTVNSYKRLVENFWAPVTVSWGLEHRAASIRIIAPPTASAKATRFEIRTPGADTNPHFVLAAILGCGRRGVEKKLKLTIPPLAKGQDVGGAADQGERLAKTLRDATNKFKRPGSVAREVFGDDFVDHFAGTREHECRLWEEAVTGWEVRRYIEMV